MAYSQKPLIDAFLTGKVPGESAAPTHIETVISNVFLFESKVYKFYKNDNEYFNSNFSNLADKETRFAYTQGDFKWNNASTPSIYIDLIGVRSIDGVTTITETADDADELVIVMNRVDTSNVLFDRLAASTLSREEAYAVGKGLGASLAPIREEKLPAYDYHALFADRITDAKAWIESTAEHFTEGETTSYINFLEEFRQNNEVYFKNEMSREIKYGGDIHSHNALLTGTDFFLMDTFSPKEDWLIEHHTVPVYRLATDIWALSGDEELFEACLAGYEAETGTVIDRKIDPLYVVYASVIALPYHYMLARTDKSKLPFARQFHDFLRNYFLSLQHA